MAGSPILQEPKRERIELAPTELLEFFGHPGAYPDAAINPLQPPGGLIRFRTI